MPGCTVAWSGLGGCAVLRQRTPHQNTAPLGVFYTTPETGTDTPLPFTPGVGSAGKFFDVVWPPAGHRRRASVGSARCALIACQVMVRWCLPGTCRSSPTVWAALPGQPATITGEPAALTVQPGAMMGRLPVDAALAQRSAEHGRWHRDQRSRCLHLAQVGCLHLHHGPPHRKETTGKLSNRPRFHLNPVLVSAFYRHDKTWPKLALVMCLVMYPHKYKQ